MPDAVSNSTLQLLIVEPVPFVMVHLPSDPVPQSEVFVQVAVTDAAAAECVIAATPMSGSDSAATVTMIRRMRDLDTSRDGLGRDGLGTDGLDIVLPTSRGRPGGARTEGGTAGRLPLMGACVGRSRQLSALTSGNTMA